MTISKEPILFADAGPSNAAAFFEALWNSGVQAVAVLSEGENWKFNDAFRRLFRLIDQAGHDEALALFEGENIQMLHKVWRGEINCFETEIRVGNDRVVSFRIVAVPLAAPVKQAILLATDATQGHIFQEELLNKLDDMEAMASNIKKNAETAQQLENFAWVASHDLKEPVRNISSFAHLLEKKYADKLDDQGREFLGFIRSSVAAMNSLIEDLTAFGQVASAELLLEAVHPSTIFLNQKKLVDRQLPAVDWVLELPANLPETIFVDKQKMGQLIYHLFHNSLKFRNLNEHPQISVGFNTTAREYVFSIKDNGIGIGPEFFERIFQLFKRLHPRQVYAGSGVGLAICQKIMEQHNGRIWVESELGAGSVFHFSFPKLEVS